MKYVQFREKILRYFRELPKDKVRQSMGIYKECGCCVGAHISHLFNLPKIDTSKGPTQHFNDGANLFIKVMKDKFNFWWDDVDSYFVLANGDEYNDDMFGSNDWSDSPYNVLKKMFELMEKDHKKVNPHA